MPPCVRASYTLRLLVRYQASSQLGGARSNLSQSSVEAANTQPKRPQTRLLLSGRVIVNTSVSLPVWTEGMKQLRTLCDVRNGHPLHLREEEHVRPDLVEFVDRHFAYAERRLGHAEVEQRRPRGAKRQRIPIDVRKLVMLAQIVGNRLPGEGDAG